MPCKDNGHKVKHDYAQYASSNDCVDDINVSKLLNLFMQALLEYVILFCC